MMAQNGLGAVPGALQRGEITAHSTSAMIEIIVVEVVSTIRTSGGIIVHVAKVPDATVQGQGIVITLAGEVDGDTPAQATEG
mmetsp:Transcript_5964/g.9034  ORF Transcript_5964/g.9034 Transcript_5964/m.9034 type:complete len:82 (-) Transcript_5964:83-328(-)